MNVFAARLGACLKRCVALFASKRAGTSCKTKLVKKSEAQMRGEFNIMLDYSNKNVLAKKGEGKKVSGNKYDITTEPASIDNRSLQLPKTQKEHSEFFLRFFPFVD